MLRQRAGGRWPGGQVTRDPGHEMVPSTMLGAMFVQFTADRRQLCCSPQFVTLPAINTTPNGRINYRHISIYIQTCLAVTGGGSVVDWQIEPAQLTFSAHLACIYNYIISIIILL